MISRLWKDSSLLRETEERSVKLLTCLISTWRPISKTLRLGLNLRRFTYPGKTTKRRSFVTKRSLQCSQITTLWTSSTLRYSTLLGIQVITLRTYFSQGSISVMPWLYRMTRRVIVSEGCWDYFTHAKPLRHSKRRRTRRIKKSLRHVNRGWKKFTVTVQ